MVAFQIITRGSLSLSLIQEFSALVFSEALCIYRLSWNIRKYVFVYLFFKDSNREVIFQKDQYKCLSATIKMLR